MTAVGCESKVDLRELRVRLEICVSEKNVAVWLRFGLRFWLRFGLRFATFGYVFPIKDSQKIFTKPYSRT